MSSKSKIFFRIFLAPTPKLLLSSTSSAVRYAVSMVLVIFGLGLFISLIVIGPLVVSLFVVGSFIQINEWLSSLSEKFFGFWSAYILMIGFIPIFLNYRSRVLKHNTYFTSWYGLAPFLSEELLDSKLFKHYNPSDRELFLLQMYSSEERLDAKFFKEGKDFDRQLRLTQIQTAYSKSKWNDNYGYFALITAFIFWAIELSVNIIPTFYVINIIGILLAASVYFLMYIPINISEENGLENYRVPKFYFPKNESIAIMTILILGASLLAGYLEYSRP
jgi:hypothetical protein